MAGLAVRQNLPGCGCRQPAGKSVWSGPMSNPFQTALQHQQAGRLQQAGDIYVALLRANPDQPEVLHQFALLHHQAGQPAEGVRHLQHAIRLAPAHAPFHANLASLLLAAGKPAAAATAAAEARRLDPAMPEAAGNLGLALAQTGRLDEAEAAFRQALALRPGFHDAAFNLANLQRDRGDHAAAAAGYRALLQALPEFFGAAVNLGVTLDLAGDFDGAIAAYRRAIAIRPELAVAHCNLGLVLQKQNRFADAVAAFRAAIARDDSLLAAHMGLGQCARELGDSRTALAAFRHAAGLAPQGAPGHDDVQAALSGLLSSQIPGWHFPMLADAARNEAYGRAIAKAVTPGMTVLDIGTGSGLLSLFAARAGAGRIVSCEAHPLIAETAQEIVAKNGYADRITVIAKRSTELTTGELDPAADLPAPADLVVSEVLDAGLTGEGMLPTCRDALKRLMKPGAAMIPARARVLAQIVSLPALRAVNPLRDLCGFDLSPFDRFRNRAAHGTARLDHEAHAALSDVLPVLDIDFRNPPDWTRPQTMPWQAAVTTAGTAQAVAFWFALWLDDEILLSSGPGGELRHWGQAVCWLPEDRAVQPGDSLAFTVTLADNHFDFRLA